MRSERVMICKRTCSDHPAWLIATKMNFNIMGQVGFHLFLPLSLFCSSFLPLFFLISDLTCVIRMGRLDEAPKAGYFRVHDRKCFPGFEFFDL